MEHLQDITVEECQDALDRIGKKRAAQRLMTAIAYKNGITQTELASWFGVERKTIYNWLTRLEERDLDAAIHDRERSGRPRKLDANELEELQEVLSNPPTDLGYEASAWTVNLFQKLILEEFGTEYSRPSCRRLMKELGRLSENKESSC